MVLEENMFVEQRLPDAVLRQLTDEELDHYRQPFRNPGEDRRPTLSFPRSLPIEGEPAEVAKAMNDYLGWLAQSDVPKLFINGEPGAIATGRIHEFIRGWSNQNEITVKGRKLLQEDSPDEIGVAISDFVRKTKSSGQSRQTQSSWRRPVGVP